MRILFVSNPLRGHVNTMLALALAARDAGHQVAFASGPDLRPVIERHGLPAWSVGPTHAQLGGSRQASWLDYFARSAAGRAAELLARARAWRPGVPDRPGNGTRLKVYVRDADALPAVDALLRQRLPGVPALLLHGHVCRRELAVEIDGVHA